MASSGSKTMTSRITSAERRESILAAAKRVFVRSGYSGARTKDIAVEAGINEALIYRHFDSKEELFDAAVLEPLEHWFETYQHMGRRVATATDSKTQLELLERGAEQYVSHVDEVVPLLGIALFASGGHGAEFYQKRLVPFVESWAARTQAATAPDALGSEIDQLFLARAGIGILVFVAMDAHFRGIPLDARETGRQLAKMMLPLFEHRGPPLSHGKD